ncbi:MAG: hypothetical protein VB140_08120 [Burkholderia sp.]
MWISLDRNPFVSPKIMPCNAIASSRSIYATTPSQSVTVSHILMGHY